MFAIMNLTVQTYANSTTWWSYRADQDTIATICTPGYFSPIAAQMLAVADMIVINAIDGNAIRFVVKSDLGSVTLAAGV